MNKICVPGQRLCQISDDFIAGYGAFERQGYIVASLAGLVKLIPEGKSIVITVETELGHNMVPKPRDIVTAQVTVITKMFARCLIKCIGDTVLSKPFRGVIKKPDVRATRKDDTEIHKCFRPGDIILARVLPVNELNSYPLSTAENELGVVIACSEAGIPMIPISWTQMQCPKTYNKEDRKVARVLPETVVVD